MTFGGGGDASQLLQYRGRGRTVVAIAASRMSASHRCYHFRGEIDLPNNSIVTVRNEQFRVVARRTQERRVAQRRMSGVATVAGKSYLARTHNEVREAGGEVDNQHLVPLADGDEEQVAKARNSRRLADGQRSCQYWVGWRRPSFVRAVHKAVAIAQDGGNYLRCVVHAAHTAGRPFRKIHGTSVVFPQREGSISGCKFSHAAVPIGNRAGGGGAPLTHKVGVHHQVLRRRRGRRLSARLRAWLHRGGFRRLRTRCGRRLC